MTKMEKLNHNSARRIKNSILGENAYQKNSGGLMQVASCKVGWWHHIGDYCQLAICCRTPLHIATIGFIMRHAATTARVFLYQPVAHVAFTVKLSAQSVNDLEW